MALQTQSTWGVTVEVLVSDKAQVSTLLVGGEEAQGASSDFSWK